MKYSQLRAAVASLRERRSSFRRWALALFFSIGCSLLPTDVHALCGLDGAVREQLRSVDDPEAVRTLSLNLSLQKTCAVCHLAGFGVGFGESGNECGNAISTRLRLSKGAPDS